MSRTKPAEERRADLLEAGQALFVTKGVAATSLEEITTGAGVSKGLFYLYFHSKEDLVVALQQQFSDQFADRISDAAAAEDDWGVKLDACVEAAFECYRDLHDLHEVLFRHSGGPGVDPAHEPAHSGLSDALRELLASGVAAGAYDNEDPGATAALLCAAIHAFAPAFHGRDRPSDARLVRATQVLFRRTAGVADRSTSDAEERR